MGEEGEGEGERRGKEREEERGGRWRGRSAWRGPGVYPEFSRGTSSRNLEPKSYTRHPTPYTLHPTPYTRHPTPYTQDILRMACSRVEFQFFLESRGGMQSVLLIENSGVGRTRISSTLNPKP